MSRYLEEIEANSSLIAAARQLYEALERLVFLFPPQRAEWSNDIDFTDYKEAHAKARAALAKARGETP